MKYFWPILFTLFLSSCVVEKGDIKVNIKKNNKTSQISSANVSAISIVNNQVIVSGNNLNVVSALKINGVSFNEFFTIESKSANQIVANANRAFSFDVSKIFELVLSDAHGSAAFPISFDLPNSSVTAPKLNSMGAAIGQVLKYDGAEWVASSLSNSQIYLGTYDATLNVPNLNLTSPISGDYYIVTTAGTFNAINYEVGDWIMHNGSAWEKISNSTNVVSSFNGRRGIVVPAAGDYSWSMLTTASGKLTGSTLGSIADIDLTGIANNKVLKWDATNLKWIMGDDLSGGGAGTVTSTEISDDTITNVDINSAAAIAYSKLNVPAGAILYSKLTVADNEIPATKVNGLTTAINGLLTATISDADTTHAPTGDAVFDALGLKLNLSGGTVTGTLIIDPSTGFLEVPTPSAATHAANQQYVLDLNALKVSKIGDTMTGVLTLENDLKMKGGTKYVSLKANVAMATDFNLTLPSSGGTPGYVLSTDGAGATSWINPAVNSASISDGSIVNADVAAAANIEATKLATGVIDNTEFNYLNGVSSAIQTQLDNKQALESTLTSLAGFNTNGIMVQTAADTFVGRTIAGTVNRIIVTDGNGVAGNPTINIPTALLPSPVLADAGKFLKATAADTALWSALTALDVTTALTYTPVNKAGDTLSSGTLTINGTAHLSLPVPTLLTDPTTKDYVDTQIAGASNQWTYGGGNVYRSSGNVGIGTTTPTSTLDVNGNIAGGSRWFFDRDGANMSWISARGTDIEPANVAWGMGSTSTGTVNYQAFRTNGVERLSISSSGNVGIGTTTPATKLHIVGDTSAAPFIIQRSSGADPTYGAHLLVRKTRGAIGAETLVQSGDELGTLWFTGYDGTTFQSSARILGLVDGTTGAADMPGRMEFQTTPDGSNVALTRMTIKNDGNVGIGTVAPTLRAHVEGVGGFPATSGTTQNGALRLGYSGGSGVLDIGQNIGLGGWIQSTNKSDLSLTYPLILNPNGGNVGIGATSPEKKLHIRDSGNPNLKIESTNEGVPGVFLTEQNGIGFKLNYDNLNNVFKIQTYESGEVETLTPFSIVRANGNIGIGNANPLYNLDVAITETGGINIKDNSATSGRAYIGEGTSSANLFSPTFLGTSVGVNRSTQFMGEAKVTEDTGTTPVMLFVSRRDDSAALTTRPLFEWRNASSTLMNMSANGNLGIGTNNPAQKLNIVGTSVTGGAAQTNISAYAGSGLRFDGSISNSSQDAITYQSGGGGGAAIAFRRGGAYETYMDFYTNGSATPGAITQAMTIDNTGNVGIGTATPSYTLHVVGTAGLSTGTAWTNASDIRLKDIHGDYEYGLNEILKLHTVRYSYKKDNPLGLPSDFSKTGFIAQEVQKVIPDAVKKREDGFLELNVDPIHWAVVNSIKDLYRKYILPLWENDKLQERAIASLRKEKAEDIAKKDREIAELKARLERIEKRLNGPSRP